MNAAGCRGASTDSDNRDLDTRRRHVGSRPILSVSDHALRQVAIGLDRDLGDSLLDLP